MEENTSLIVTIGVITYNSSKTVVETLESIRLQTYPLSKIELLIGDDCSTDNTAQIVRAWLASNGQLFYSAAIVESEKNMGIAHNCNQILNSAHGSWYKGIAGDDLLKEECISRFVSFINAHQDTSVCFSRMEPFDGHPTVIEKVRNNFKPKFFSKTIEEQLFYLIHDYNCLPAPSAFMNLEWIRDKGLQFDERIPMLEDWPMWINMLRAGAVFKMLDEELVKYRLGGITSKHTSMIFYRSLRLFHMHYIFPEVYSTDRTKAIMQVVDEECEVYEEMERLLHTKAYRIGKAILYPYNKLRYIIKK